MLHLKRLSGILLLFLLVAVASAAAYRYISTGSVFPQTKAIGKLDVSLKAPAKIADPNIKGDFGTYIVLFRDAPLASYKGGKPGFAMPTKMTSASGKSRLDVKSYESQKYVSYLQQQQRTLESKMSAVIGGKALRVRNRMQHAVNGIVVDFTAADAAKIAKMADVMLVEGYREYPLESDTGPVHIGAAPVWNGTYQNATGAYQGEGMVVAILDSGINFGSPSFSAVDPVDAYTHTNPFGSGNYLGTCATGQVDAGRCNNKLIGGYDFVCGAPGNTCGAPSILEEPGFGDSNSHGSHTASTVAGNRRDVVVSGNPRRISGVAPRANIIAYDVCYTNTATGQGLCPNVSSAAAVNQAIADGVVDSLNFSIGGGTSPWSDAVSLAFLSAVDAGIYVAASAGNSGPAANTLGHVEPWVSTTAAAQHGRGGFAVLMQVTGPVPVPANLAPLVVNQGSGGVAFAATIPGTTPLKVSAGIDTTSDGCAAFSAGAFTGAIAVIRRGGCSFAVKVNSASAAGAIAVVIANNVAGVIIPSVPGTTVPAFSVLQTEGNALRDFYVANPSTATAQISFPAVGLPNTPDALASFSSRGPAGVFDLIKPDITGPGVDILAVMSGTVITGSEQLVGLMSGTSMSSPHNAGSGALMRQARPSWTVPEIKSALMMTAVTTVYTEDQVTLANAFAKGAGRLQIDRAVNAGLVLHETTANFQAANPGIDGDVKTLNIPSYANRSCSPTCSFTRTFRNTQSAGRMWNLKVTGLTGTVSSPSVFIPAGQSRALTFTINTAKIPNNGKWFFGEVVLTPALTTPAADASPVLRMPIAVAVAPPAINLPVSVSKSMDPNTSSTVDITVGNIGGSKLNYTVSNTGTGTVTPVSNPRLGVNNGFRNTIFTPASGTTAAQFNADDFDIIQPTNITSLSTEGFVVSAVALSAATSSLRWSIYPDAAGVPAGNPQSAPGAAVWTYSTALTGAGVSIVGGTVTLNLAAASQNVTLPPGKYWMVMNTVGTLANSWAQFASNTSNGLPGFKQITVSTTNTGAWVTPATAFVGLNVVVKGSVTCGASWLGAAFPSYGTLAPAQSGLNSVAVNTTGMFAGSYIGNVCYNSNDPFTPTAAAPVLLTVTNPP